MNPRPMTDDEKSFAMCLDSLLHEARIYDLWYWEPLTQHSGHVEQPFADAASWTTFELIYNEEKSSKFRKPTLREWLELHWGSASQYEGGFDDWEAVVKAEIASKADALELVRKVVLNRWDQCESQQAELQVGVALKASGA